MHPLWCQNAAMSGAAVRKKTWFSFFPSVTAQLPWNRWILRNVCFEILRAENQRDVAASCMDGWKPECVGCRRCCPTVPWPGCSVGLTGDEHGFKEADRWCPPELSLQRCFHKGLHGMAFLLLSSSTLVSHCGGLLLSQVPKIELPSRGDPSSQKINKSVRLGTL